MLWYNSFTSFQFVVYPHGGSWRWKPANRRPSLLFSQKANQARINKLKRDGAILRLLAQELLTAAECQLFLEALQQFRLSNSLVILCEYLKPVINTTQKFVLLVEVNKRLPVRLQEEFRLLCCHLFPHYDIYLQLLAKRRDSEVFSRIFPEEIPEQFITAGGSYRKLIARYRNQRRLNELQSLVGTSDVTSGICTDSEDVEDQIDTDVDEKTPNKNVDISDTERQTVDTLNGLKDQSNVDISDTELQKVEALNSRKYKPNVKCIHLVRSNQRNLGFGIIGGREYGRDIFISLVEDGSIAASQVSKGAIYTS